MMDGIKKYKNTHQHRSQTCIVVLIALVTLVVFGCATSPAKAPPFPLNPDAKKHYNIGEEFIQTGQYQMAVEEFQKSIEIESNPYMAHAKLAISYYAQNKYLEAANEFEQSYRVIGGIEIAPSFAILQAISLQKNGELAIANKLLIGWTGSSIQTDGTGKVWSVSGGKFPSRYWKSLGKYLMGDVSEDKLLKQKVSQDEMIVSYLVIGIKSIEKGEMEKAKKYLQAVIEIVGPRRWRSDLAKVELERIAN